MEELPQSVVASASPAALAAKRAERDSRPTVNRFRAFTCRTCAPQNGHALSLCFTCRPQDGQGVNLRLTDVAVIVLHFSTRRQSRPGQGLDTQRAPALSPRARRYGWPSTRPPLWTSPSTASAANWPSAPSSSASTTAWSASSPGWRRYTSATTKATSAGPHAKGRSFTSLLGTQRRLEQVTSVLTARVECPAIGARAAPRGICARPGKERPARRTRRALEVLRETEVGSCATLSPTLAVSSAAADPDKGERHSARDSRAHGRSQQDRLTLRPHGIPPNRRERGLAAASNREHTCIAQEWRRRPCESRPRFSLLPLARRS
jgi:hypothetical protein